MSKVSRGDCEFVLEGSIGVIVSTAEAEAQREREIRERERERIPNE